MLYYIGCVFWLAHLRRSIRLLSSLTGAMSPSHAIPQLVRSEDYFSVERYRSSGAEPRGAGDTL